MERTGVLDVDVGRSLLSQADARFIDACDEEEFAPHDRNRLVADHASARGCVPGTAEAVLRFDVPAGAVPALSAATAPLTDELAASMAELHDRIFAGTHTCGERLVTSETTLVRTAAVDGELAGDGAERVRDGTDQSERVAEVLRTALDDPALRLELSVPAGG